LNILIYDDENLEYKTGILVQQKNIPDIIEFCELGNPMPTKIKGRSVQLIADVGNFEEKETIKLDDTLMKRIAKYNKETEVEKLDEKLKAKGKKLKELEEKIEDREQRWKKIQTFVSKIYELPLEDDDDDYYDEDY